MGKEGGEEEGKTETRQKRKKGFVRKRSDSYMEEAPTKRKHQKEEKKGGKRKSKKLETPGSLSGGDEAQREKEKGGKSQKEGIESGIN